MKAAVTDFEALFSTEKRSHVKWDHDEWHQLATEVIEIRVRHPRKSAIELVNLAQKNLHKVGKWTDDRLRKIRTNNEISKLFPIISQIDRDRQTIFQHAIDVHAKQKELEHQGSECALRLTGKSVQVGNSYANGSKRNSRAQFSTKCLIVSPPA